MTMLGKMDRLVFATRLDRIIFLRIQPRTLRWIPLLVIAVLVAGYVLMAEGLRNPSFPIGLALFYGALLASYFVRMFGPRFLPTELRPLDERELMVKARAYSISGVLIASFAMLGCFYMASADVLGFWRPQTTNDWITLGFALQASGLLLPTLIASWLEPRPEDDHED